MSEAPAFAIEGLRAEIRRRRVAPYEILHGVSLALARGSMHAVVGETGCGKTMTVKAALGLAPPELHVTAGSVHLGERSLLGRSERELASVRGCEVAMVFQNPRTALYPLLPIGRQMDAVLRAHTTLDAAARAARIASLLGLVGMVDVERVVRAYPHELSGGMAQRVVIATALVAEPAVLIADEPTTGLDVTVQRQILDLLAELRERLSLSVLTITHDLGIVAQYCDRITVMQSGSAVEDGEVRAVLRDPQHPYTRTLVEASRLDRVSLAAKAAT